MPKDHLEAVPGLQRHLRRIRHRRQPVTDETVPQGIVLPGERFPALNLRKRVIPEIGTGPVRVVGVLEKS